MEGCNMREILLKNGTIVDGSGAKPYVADVLLSQGRIARIGRGIDAPGAEAIDVSGKHVTPGFINMHSHADCSAAMYPNMESSLGQGITTEFAGHCGLGVAPVRDYWMYVFPEKRAFTRVMPEPIGGINPYHFYALPTDALRSAFREAYGETLDWTSYGEYIAHLKRAGTGCNFALVAGQSHIRLQAMGLDFRRDATEAEIRAMEGSLSEAMDGGAMGLSLGLDYQPSLYASREEMLRLMRLVARRGGIVTAHTRSVPNSYYGREVNFHSGLIEFLDLGLESGARVHVSHIQNAYKSTPDNAAMARAGVEQTLEILERYRQKGLKVGWDVIPCHAFGPFHYPMAASLFQPYVEQCGGVGRFAELLRTGNYFDVIEAEIRGGNHASRGVFTRINPVQNPDWDTKQRFTKVRNAAWMGKTIREAAQGRDSLRFLMEVLRDDPYACVISLYRRPEEAPDRDAFVEDAQACIGLDTWSFDYSARLNEGDLPLECGSPATYSGMTRFLEDQRARPLEDCVRRLTGNAAKCLGLSDRGLIREGYRADVLVIDFARFSSNEDLSDPRRGASGLELVVVNGEVAVRDGVHTHARSGQIL